MEWMTVISLILIGIVLVVVEIILVPGTTIVGILGIGLCITGIVLSFSYFGSSTGWITLGGTAVVSGVLFYLSLRTRLWDRFALKSTIEGKVNEGDRGELKVGHEGTAVSALRPSGKIDFDGKMLEGTTLGNYVESGTRVRVIRISSHQIFVEPIN